MSAKAEKDGALNKKIYMNEIEAKHRADEEARNAEERKK
jgi:hypothetical protein